jgi:hypothetical protein
MAARARRRRLTGGRGTSSWLRPAPPLGSSPEAVPERRRGRPGAPPRPPGRLLLPRSGPEIGIASPFRARGR